jgi:hypothetical protein
MMYPVPLWSFAPPDSRGRLSPQVPYPLIADPKVCATRDLATVKVTMVQRLIRTAVLL